MECDFVYEDGFKCQRRDAGWWGLCRFHSEGMTHSELVEAQVERVTLGEVYTWWKDHGYLHHYKVPVKVRTIRRTALTIRVLVLEEGREVNVQPMHLSPGWTEGRR